MRFLCSTFGSAGDVFPMLGLAIELKRRGHEITFATNSHFESMVRSYDLPFESLGTEEDFQACVNHPDLWHPQRAFPHIMKCLEPILRHQYAMHVDYAARGDFAAVANCLALGARLAGEKIGFPVITLHLQPAVIWSDVSPPGLPGLFGPRWLKRLLFRVGERFVIDPVVGRFLNPWRRELGLQPMKQTVRWWNSPDGVLCMFPAWYAPPQADWPAGIMQTDFPMWNHRTEETLSDDLRAFLDRGSPPIVFTPGSANLHGRDFFQAAALACKQLDRRAVFLSQFAEHIPQNLSDAMLHVKYVPLDLLLPRAAAFVHHGGIGSASQALAAGIPQIIMPLAHDQFDNAARIQRLGVGDELHPQRFTAARLAPMLRRLLESSTVAAACRHVGTLCRTDGIIRSADALERRFARK